MIFTSYFYVAKRFPSVTTVDLASHIDNENFS